MKKLQIFTAAKNSKVLLKGYCQELSVAEMNAAINRDLPTNSDKTHFHFLLHFRTIVPLLNLIKIWWQATNEH